MSKKVCHCAHCWYEDYCADNDWSLSDEFDPCCPNMIGLRKQLKEFNKSREDDLSLAYIDYSVLDYEEN